MVEWFKHKLKSDNSDDIASCGAGSSPASLTKINGQMVDLTEAEGRHPMP